jgi:hypothetical protein
VAELVARPPTYFKIGGSNLGVFNVFALDNQNFNSMKTKWFVDV